MDEHLEPLGLRVSVAARLLDCSESTVRRCLKSGELKGFHVRSGVRVDREDLDRYIRAHRYRDFGVWREATTLARWFSRTLARTGNERS